MSFLYKKLRCLSYLSVALWLLACQSKVDSTPELISTNHNARIVILDKHQDAEGNTQTMIDYHAGSREMVKLSYSYSEQVNVDQAVHVPLVFTTQYEQAIRLNFSQQPSIRLLSAEQLTLVVNQQGQAFYELIFIPTVAGKHYIKFMLSVEEVEQVGVQVMSIPVYVADSDGKLPVPVVPATKHIDLPLHQY